MRASTLFALTAAVILGLVVATVAKYSGFFTPPPVAVVPPVKKVDVLVLVAAKNLFAGDTMSASSVKVRALRAEEVDGYQGAKDQFMPAVVQAASLRVPNKNIYADQPILKSDLKEMAKPDALNLRLMPTMRAMDLLISKERSAGGLIQTGDWVDVLLTSEIEGDHHKVVRTAAIASRVRVIAKRDTLYQVFEPLPEGKPVAFMVEVNPYRAALIEWSRTKGELSLTPLASSEQRLLEAQRDRLMQNPQRALLQTHFLAPESPEADEEEARVSSFNRGEGAISEFDLIRIFGLKTPPPPISNIEIQRLYGPYRADPAVFSPTGEVISDAVRGGHSYGADRSRQNAQMAPNFQFRAVDCPTCGANKGKKATTK